MSDLAAVAYEARNKALQVERDQQKHEDICAERYSGINDSIRSIRAILLWGGGVAMTTILAALGFLTANLITTNAQRVVEQQAQIQMIQERMRSDAER